MKFGRMIVLSLAALLVAAPAVHAQDDMGDPTTKKPTRRQTVEEESNDPARSGVMLGVGAVWALDQFDGIGLDTDSSGAFNVHLGYRFNPRVAADLHVERYNQFGAPTGEVNGWALGLNGRGYILTGKVQPFLLMGLNLLDMETTNSAAPKRQKTDDGPALRFGTGIDWYLTNKVALVGDVSYVLGLGDVEGYDVIAFSLGFMFRP